MKILYKTRSLCDKCLQEVPAFTFIKNGRVFLQKECPKHGKFSGDHAWDDPKINQGLHKIDTLDAKSAQVAIAVTYKCNLTCPVCYARANEVDISDLKIEDLKRVDEYPVIFLTGGEPTIREDLPEIVSTLKRKGKKVVMFSNGLKLAQKGYARKLKRAGLGCVILQFDTLDDAEYQYIRGRKLIEIKKKAVANMQRSNLPVYLYCTMLKGKSFNQMENIFNFARKYSVIKTVSVNPLWRLGRYNENDFVPSSQILKRASQINGLKRSDWLESTELLCGVDKLLSLISSRRRLFCKCNLKCLVLRHKNRTIPVTRIFDTKKINQKINDLYERKNRSGFWSFLLYFFANQVVLNFFKNRNFRLFVLKTLKNTGHLLRGDYLLFNPFHFVTIAIFPTPTNLDFSFVSQCNFNAISSEDFGFEPGCIHRIKALKKDEKRKANNLKEK